MKAYINRILVLLTIAFISIYATPPKPVSKPTTYVDITTRFGTMKVKLYDETPKHRDNFIKLVKQGFYDSLTFHFVGPDFIAQGGDPKSRYATEDSVIGDSDLGYKIPAEINPTLFHKYGALVAARDQNPTLASNASQFYLVRGKRFTLEQLMKIEDYKSQRIKSDILYTLMQSDTAKARMEDFTLRGDKEGMKAYVASFQPVAENLFNRRGPYRFTSHQVQEYTSIGGIPPLDSGYTVFGEVISGRYIIDSLCSQPTAKNGRPLKDIRMKIRISKK
ncbi:MAG: peptidylprolyl isomerase [Bacteroidota bacterium]